MMDESRTPVLSVVIIGRNEGERLVGCLESVRQIRGVEGKVEVIYVDSASMDGSPQIARNLDAQVVVLQDGKRTAARGRNAGWPRALAPYVLFLDGDTILHPDFAGVALASLTTDQSIAAVWGHRRELYPERSLYNRVADLDWIYAAGIVDYCGGDVLMRRSALAEVDGYDSDLIAGEEPELCRRLRSRGYRILHIDQPMTMHDLDLRRFSQYWKRATRAGYAYAEISNRFRSSPDKMWLQESKRNAKLGIFWITWFLLGICLAAFTSWLFIPWLAFVLLVTARSGWKARSKAPGKGLLLQLYGIHSHMQQIPILFGQLSYFADRYLGKQRKQIEYKEGANA
jgi:cellulose synthase/poly-beta-1,6-N-acetylglucosamine synthase-like glycosyltransferase